MFDTTIILEAVIALVMAVLTGLAIPYVKSITTASQQEQIVKWVNVAVMAAEQLFDSDQGETKKDYVVEYLNSIGIAVEGEEIDALIESAVYQLTSEFNLLEEEFYDPTTVSVDQ